MLLITAFDLILNQADIIMVGSMLTTKEAGLYSAASRLSTIVPFSIAMVNSVAAPLISQLYSQGRLQQLQKMIIIVAWGSLIVSVPLCLIIILGAKLFLGIYGPEFISGTIALSILAIGRLFVALTGSAGYLMSMSGFQKQAAIVLGIAAAANIGLNVILIPAFGIEGAAISFSVTSAFWCITLAVYGYRLTGINPTVFTRQANST
jgi:O-antigen/teichoic acid export membrane protein